MLLIDGENSMNRVMTAAAALAAAATFSFAATPALAAEPGVDGSKTLATDFRGRPPFARAHVDAPADLARFEETAPASAESIGTDFRGRPPFKRNVRVDADAKAVDFARFEEIDDSKPRRRGPPGKPGSRR